MATLKIETVNEVQSFLGEGPVWDEARQSISWVDIINGKIHEWFTLDDTYNEIDVQQMIGAVALCSDEKYIAALKSGFSYVDRKSKRIDFITHPEPQLSNNRFNDGKCDPSGRFWAGTMSLTEEPEAGSLYVLNNDLSTQKKISALTISNGMAWSPDHKTLYHIDTPTLLVNAYDYDEHTGSIRNGRPVIQFDGRHGFPDGMTIDNEGMLWIAHWNGWQVSRWNPLSGHRLHSFALPVANVTSCTFGGKDFNDLYITTAKKGLTDAELIHQPLAGSLFVIRDCGFTGIPAFRFHGPASKQR